ncbi:hypothetical protein [Endozoicomonas sp. ALD040]|uniref:hypothetical protein n=1 Tax=unclassified Endozoicomonas TaxID=2644528 RepID=UPI003BB04CDB
MKRSMIIFLFISFISTAAEIKKISNNQFEYKNNQGDIRKILIDKPIGMVNYIAVIRQAIFTRFLIRTNDGNHYLHHEAFEVPDSPLAAYYKQLSDNQRTPFVTTEGLYNLASAGTFLNSQQPATKPRHVMITTALSDVQRSSSGDELYIRPMHENDAFVRVTGGVYSIVFQAHFK